MAVWSMPSWVDANDAQARFNRGLERLQNGDLEAAVAEFRAAVAVQPEQSSAHHNLGVALMALGRDREAEESYRHAVRLDPGNGQALACLSKTLLRLGRTAEATDQARRAVDLVPTDPSFHFDLAVALATDGKLQEAEQEYVEALRLQPDLAAAENNMGLLLVDRGQRDEGIARLRRATELAPENPHFAANLRIAAAAEVPMWHFSMMNDAERNLAFDKAIAESVQPGELVLEIGTGSGLLAMMAARAGARQVVTCEINPAIAHKAKEIIDCNGFEDRVRVIGKGSGQVRIPEDLPERADVLLAEIISSDVIGEGLLDTFEDARRRLIARDATILPLSATVRCQLAGASGLDQYTRVESVAGFDLSLFNQFSPVKVHPADGEFSFDLQSEPFDAFEFDFPNTDYFPEDRKSIAVPVTKAGTCVGVLQWIRLQLSENVAYQNAPERDGRVRRSGHWQQVLHTFAEPIEVSSGQVLHVVAAHNRRNLIFHVNRVEQSP